MGNRIVIQCSAKSETRARCQARILSPVETPEYPEWVGTAISQSAGDEMVTCVEIASYRVVFAEDANAGCHVRPLETGVALPWTCFAAPAEPGPETNEAPVGTWAKNGTFLSSLPGLVPVPSGQPTVGNGGLGSVVPMGLQLRGHSLPTGQSASSKAASHMQVGVRRRGTLRLAERRRSGCQSVGQRTSVVSLK